MIFRGVGCVNTLGKSFLSSQEIPNCNFTHENTNVILVSMDIEKWSPLQQLEKTEEKVTLSSLALSVSLGTESSFSFSNSWTYSLFSLLLVMYRLFFLCTYEAPSPAELWHSWYLPTCAGNITEFLLLIVSFLLPLAILHCISLDMDKPPYQVQKGIPS